MIVPADEARQGQDGEGARSRAHGELARLFGEGRVDDAIALATRLWQQGAWNPAVPALLALHGGAEVRDQAGSAAVDLAAGRALDLGSAVQSVACDPESLSEWAALLQALLARGKVAEAIEGVGLALHEGRAGRELWLLLASTLSALGYADRVGDAASVALRTFPGDPAAWALLALELVREGRVDEARDAASRALRLHPASSISWLARAVAENAAGLATAAGVALAHARARGVGSVLDAATCRTLLDALCARERLRFATARTMAQSELAGRRAGLDESWARILDREGGNPLAALSCAFSLTTIERDFVSAVVAATIDVGVSADVHALQGSTAKHGLTAATFARVAGLNERAAMELCLALTTEHHAQRAGLLRCSDAELSPLHRPYQADPRLIRFLIDPGTAGLDSQGRLQRIDLPQPAIFDAEQHGLLRQMLDTLGPEPVVLIIEGRPGTGRRTAAAWLAAQMCRPAVLADLAPAARDANRLRDLLAQLEKEVRFTGALPVIESVERVADADASAVMSAFLDRLGEHVVCLSGDESSAVRCAHRVLRLAWPLPETAARRAMWVIASEASGGVEESALEELAQRYRIGAGAMMRAVRAARSFQHQPGRLTTGAIVDGIRQDIVEQMTGLATRVRTRQTWDDLVLASDTREQIRSLAARVRHAHLVYETWGVGNRGRSTGTAALFSGPPGTGKTMVAGLIANELDLDLYQVDLSQVVSKWIGETEKQLARLFDATATGSCLLLFDEADALFAKRTEVRSSNDRYANLEVNYLLQRIEAFNGVVILTTNLEASIDPAFKRRLSSHVVFWPPDEEERVELWTRYLRCGAPLSGDIDVESLAREYPELSGAHIRNATVAAAFSAADGCVPITHEALAAAARGEYAAMGRTLSRSRPRAK